MSDLTVTQIAAQISDPALKAWVESWDDLPTGVDTAEFLAKFLQAGYRAQIAYNTATPVPSPTITAYQQPIFGAVSLNTTTGFSTYLATYGVQVRIPGDLDIAVATNV
ncbi:hypothetical protein JYQ62_16155 [Nostoc sp. UHCC 0702]|nr:hypothetical protein JYQ62_16155 [Nostoc sp. UHCC 0702]